jgi:Domain of unknown function (DUF4158)
VGRDLGLDGVVDHFTLNSDEAGWLRNKTGATRLGFAVQLKFLLWRRRFPRMRLELPPDAIEHVANQVGVAASELAFYDFTSRAAKRHRSELRDLTGWHECTKTDQVKLISHLVDVIWHDERREEQVRAELLRQMRADLIEPPTAAQVDTIVRSALHHADERAVAEVAARLARAEGCTRRLDALVFTDPTAEQGDTAAEDDGTDQDEDDVESVLADIKAHPGNVSLNSLLDEISKLKQVRAVGVPEKAFAGIGVQVINAWRARASASSPSHLRRFNPELRHVLLAALLFQRQREITDTLVELLNSTVHRINARAEKKVTEAFVAEFTKVRGKAGLLGKIAAASLGAPEGSVREVIYPAADGEKTLKDLVAEMKATNAAFARSKREVFKSSYSNHYRAGLMKLLEVLDFRSSNDKHKPVIEALALIERHKDSSTTYLPIGETVPLEGVVRKDWMEFALHTPDKGPRRVIRTVYEACVFQALRDRLRCKEIWVVGADKWRNPDEDLPDDFETRRAEYYEKLNKPRDVKVFIAQLQAEMRGHSQADRAAFDRSRSASASTFHAFPSIERHQCGFRDYAPAPSDLGWQRSPLYSHHQTPCRHFGEFLDRDYLDIPFNLGEVKVSVVAQEPDVIRVVVEELLNDIIRPPQRGDQSVLTETFEAHAVLPARHRHVPEVSKFHVAHRRTKGLPRRGGCCSTQHGSLRGRPHQAVGSPRPTFSQRSGPGSEETA